MRHSAKAWLVSYDIREPRRLRRVHKCLRREGVPAQYSVFTVEADDEEISQLLDRIEALIDSRVDDVRAYHLPHACTVWSLGCQDWPAGITLTGTHAARVLNEALAPEAPADTDTTAH